MGAKGETAYWDTEAETAPRQRIVERQWRRLLGQLSYVQDRSSFYKTRFADRGVDLTAIGDLRAFRELIPMTSKDELRAVRERTRDPYGGLLCVPPEDVVYLCRTAGTTGVPSMYGLTRGDVDTLGDLTARCWYQIGARSGHTVACATMGGWNNFSKALVEGLRVTGIRTYHFAMPVPEEEVFPIEVLPQWMDIQGLYLSARPLLQVTQEYGERLKTLLPKLEYLFVAGQRMTKSLRKGIESLWGGRMYEAYPMTDVGMPCANCTGQVDTFHFPEDHFLVEVIDPETARDLTGSGQVGELVVTALVAEGTPLLRFRTEDMGYTITEPCPCGRTGMRLGLAERAAHAVQVGARLVYAHEVEEVIYELPELLFRPYHLVKKRDQPQDRLMVRIERPEGDFAERAMAEEVANRLWKVLAMEADVQFISRDDERFRVGYKYLRVVSE